MPSPKDTGGPLVKTGPTAGKVRSRNKNGRYRKKRSDAGVPRRTTYILEKACEIIIKQPCGPSVGVKLQEGTSIIYKRNKKGE